MTTATLGTEQALTSATPAEVRAWMQAGEAVVIDVREADEHERESIEGTRLMPLSQFDPGQAWFRVDPKRLVLYCRTGRRSEEACRLAGRAIGGASAINMTGGIEAWKAAGLPVKVNASAPRMSVMRQTQMVIGFMVLLGAVLGWLVHPGFLGVAAFFGAGLMVAGLTGTCGMASVIGAMPWNRR